MENASHYYSSDEVKKMIKRQKEVGWEFLFIGANIDAVETAKRYGIGSDRVANYKADSQGTEILYESVSAAVSQVWSHAPLSAKWNKKWKMTWQAENKPVYSREPFNYPSII